MKDAVIIRKIQANTRLGIYEEELLLGQAVYVDLELILDLSKAGNSDHIDDTVNYVEVVILVRELAAAKQYNLLEHLAQSIINKLFAKFDKINAITIEIHKGIINAPQFSGTPSVRLQRLRL
jgi:7,8-dihydroneopterin aldolase/epimerase/oxygenase